MWTSKIWLNKNIWNSYLNILFHFCLHSISAPTENKQLSLIANSLIRKPRFIYYSASLVIRDILLDWLTVRSVRGKWEPQRVLEETLQKNSNCYYEQNKWFQNKTITVVFLNLRSVRRPSDHLWTVKFILTAFEYIKRYLRYYASSSSHPLWVGGG